MRSKKGSISYYKKKLDKLFSTYIRSRGICEAQGATDKSCSSVLQCGHIIGRRNLWLRWNAKNALCLCLMHHLHWQHKEPLQFTEWFSNAHPERYDYLMKERKKIAKWTVDELREMCKLYE